jgi:DNA-binding CsgD family transcriptional regulator
MQAGGDDMRLSHRDYEALVQAIFELHEYRDLNRFRQEVPAIILKLVPCDYFSITEYQIDPAAPRQMLTDYVESHACITPELTRQMGDKIMLHPFTEYFLKGGRPTALKISDFLTQPQFYHSPIYDTQLLWGFNHCMAVPITAVPGKAAAFAVNDRKRDFTERDRLVLNLLQRHFDQALRNARQATVRLTIDAKPLAAYGLTPREAEIGHWVARGKTNTEIAVILGCRPRTIEKHMEKVLEKLGVVNRVAAAVIMARAGESAPH